jgi:hypothetical protein
VTLINCYVYIIQHSHVSILDNRKCDFDFTVKEATLSLNLLPFFFHLCRSLSASATRRRSSSFLFFIILLQLFERALINTTLKSYVAIAPPPQTYANQVVFPAVSLDPMVSKVLMAVWAALDVLLLAAGVVALALSIVWRAPNILMNMVLSSADLTGATSSGYFLLVELTLSQLAPCWVLH